MRVLIINTSENIGGAAIAANRLMEALKNNGVKAKMLVRDKRTDQITVASLPQSPLLKAKFVWERVCIWKANRFKKHNLFQVDLANTGTDVTSLPEFKEADVIHLHWVNQGFLSLKDIRRIIDSGKPIVWTMHDQWPFTGICHYSGECTKYQTECHHCTEAARMTCRPRCSDENSKCCVGHISFSWLAADGWKAWHAKVRFWSGRK